MGFEEEDGGVGRGGGGRGRRKRKITTARAYRNGSGIMTVFLPERGCSWRGWKMMEAEGQ